MKIAGVAVEEGQVAELVRRQLEDGIVWNDKEDQDAVEGLSRAMRVSGAMRPAFGQALADLLADPNITVRTGAVSALQDFAHLVGADRLAELLRDQPELYSKVEPQGYRLGFGELETAMYALLGNAATRSDSAAIEQLREGARKGQSVVLPALARLDPPDEPRRVPGRGCSTGSRRRSRILRRYIRRDRRPGRAALLAQLSPLRPPPACG